MVVQSKLTPITTTCIEYVHPWTNSCSIATAELLVHASQECLRIYSTVYMLSLLMRGRIPTLTDLKRTFLGILQSAAFLTTSAFSYSMFLCFLRSKLGGFNIITVSYFPAFMSSICAILIERASRRNLLSLYVTNHATETIWNMLVNRGIVKNIKHGAVIIYAISTTVMLYYYRIGVQHHYKDSLFDILRFVIGKEEEHKPTKPIPAVVAPTPPHKSRSNIMPKLKIIVKTYNELINQFKKIPIKHATCTHANDSCVSYTLSSGVKLFSIGLGIQIILKLAFQMKKIWRNPALLKRILFSKDTMKLGMFLGGFSALYRLISCVMRHLTNQDSPLHAIPAGLIASTAFVHYPDTTVALYIMWKMLQISYNIGTTKGYLPKVPGFTILLYCASTATLFHAATLEPHTLRPSYWKFLHGLSGGRIAVMGREAMDVWNLQTSYHLKDVCKRLNTNSDILFRLE